MDSATPVTSKNINNQVINTPVKEKGINLQIAEAKSSIVDAINKSNMPPGILLMILGEITSQVMAQNAAAVNAELKEFTEGEEQNGEEIHKD